MTRYANSVINHEIAAPGAVDKYNPAINLPLMPAIG
jgi:hypothetical protein